MTKVRKAWIVGVVLVGAFAMGTVACQLRLAPGEEAEDQAEGGLAVPQDEPALVIQNESELPETYPQAAYEVRFHARGGVPVLHWKLEKGALPPGIKFEDDGLLQGKAERAGEFQFTVSVTDGGKPQQAVQKGFVLRVRSALSLNWKAPARVNGSRIAGSVEVSNTTPDDIDLTFDVKAVAEDGRATEIGYQHFVLARGTIAKELPFGETLPHGAYTIYVNAAGEVAPKNVIYREQMQTPGPLQVTVGP
jgi:hypothetical protein